MPPLAMMPLRRHYAMPCRRRRCRRYATPILRAITLAAPRRRYAAAYADYAAAFALRYVYAKTHAYHAYMPATPFDDTRHCVHYALPFAAAAMLPPCRAGRHDTIFAAMPATLRRRLMPPHYAPAFYAITPLRYFRCRDYGQRHYHHCH